MDEEARRSLVSAHKKRIFGMGMFAGSSGAEVCFLLKRCSFFDFMSVGQLGGVTIVECAEMIWE